MSVLQGSNNGALRSATSSKISLAKSAINSSLLVVIIMFCSLRSYLGGNDFSPPFNTLNRGQTLGSLPTVQHVEIPPLRYWVQSIVIVFFDFWLKTRKTNTRKFKKQLNVRWTLYPVLGEFVWYGWALADPTFDTPPRNRKPSMSVKQHLSTYSPQTCLTTNEHVKTSVTLRPFW